MTSHLRDEDRRKELGKMIMDVAKYLATVGLIGGILTNHLTFANGLAIIFLVALLLAVAFFTIPPGKGDQHV